MATGSGFAQPTYIHTGPATAILSETRPVRPTQTLLHAINLLIDEILWLSLDSCSDPGPTEAQQFKLASSSPSSSTTTTTTSTTEKGSIEVPLTTDRFKSAGVLKVLANGVGKNAVLESELAIRELVRIGGPDARRDPALQVRSRSPRLGGPEEGRKREEVEVVFGQLRRWCDSLSPLGARHVSSPSSSAGGFSTGSSITDSTVPLVLLPTTLSSIASSLPSASPSLITPALGLWTTAGLTYLAEYILRGVSRIVERDPTLTLARPEHLLVFAGEDEGGIWPAFEGMRVRAFVEREVLASSPALTNGTCTGNGNGNGNGGEGKGRSRKDTITGGRSRSFEKDPSSTKRPKTADAAPTWASTPATPPANKLKRNPSSRSKPDPDPHPLLPAPVVSSGTSTGGGGIMGLKRMGSTTKKPGLEKEKERGRLRSSSNKSGRSGGGKVSLETNDDDSTTVSQEDAFEELVLSGKTMKVSLTPGRLRTMEVLDPATTPSSSEPTSRSATATPSTPNPSSTAKSSPSKPGLDTAKRSPLTTPRLQARSPRVDKDLVEAPLEEDEGVEAAGEGEGLDSEDERMGYRRARKADKKGGDGGGKTKKEARMDLADFLKSVEPPSNRMAAARPSTAPSTGPTAVPSGATTGGKSKKTFEPREATHRRNDTKDLASFLAELPPPPPPSVSHTSSHAGSARPVEGHASRRTGSSSTASLNSSGEADGGAGGKGKRKKGLMEMMSRFTTSSSSASLGAGSGRKDDQSEAAHSRALKSQRSVGGLRGAVDSTPTPTVPEIPPQHRTSASSAPTMTDPGRDASAHPSSSLLVEGGEESVSSTSRRPATTMIPFGGGGAVPMVVRSLAGDEGRDRGTSLRPAPQRKTSVKRKPVPVDEAGVTGPGGDGIGTLRIRSRSDGGGNNPTTTTEEVDRTADADGKVEGAEKVKERTISTTTSTTTETEGGDSMATAMSSDPLAAPSPGLPSTPPPAPVPKAGPTAASALAPETETETEPEANTGVAGASETDVPLPSTPVPADAQPSSPPAEHEQRADDEVEKKPSATARLVRGMMTPPSSNPELAFLAAESPNGLAPAGSVVVADGDEKAAQTEAEVPPLTPPASPPRPVLLEAIALVGPRGALETEAVGSGKQVEEGPREDVVEETAVEEGEVGEGKEGLDRGRDQAHDGEEEALGPGASKDELVEASVRRLRDDMATASSVDDCLALVDSLLRQLAGPSSPALPVAEATTKDALPSSADPPVVSEEEATVVAWLFGEHPTVETDEKATPTPPAKTEDAAVTTHAPAHVDSQ